MLLDLALEAVDHLVLMTDGSARAGSRRSTSVDGSREALLGEAAHLRDLAVERLELFFESADRVLTQGHLLQFALRASTEAAGDVVLRALFVAGW